LRVAFVYPNPRGDLPLRVAAGEAPDTSLLGANHLVALGVDAFIHDSFLRKTTPRTTVAHRLSWHAREIVLPWELHDADVLITPLANLLPIFSRLRRKPRVLLIAYHLVSGWERAGPVRHALQRRSLHAAAGVLASSEAARQRLLGLTGVDEEHIRTATLGVDATWWQPLPMPRDGYVLTVGRDLARDYETFAQAMAGLDVRGVIVAKEENLREVELPPNVEVRLNISPSDVKALYLGASCVVVPVRRESDPRGTENSGTVALLEAMACARPVVVSDRSFLADYVSEETTHVVPPAEPEAMRAAIEAVMADPAAATAMGAAARRSVEEQHTTRHFAERLVAAIEELA
jgi:glycosyltransferase involved in cell wall biosynthesis